jgi:hypothetical protein
MEESSKVMTAFLAGKRHGILILIDSQMGNAVRFIAVRHVTGNDQDYLRKIPRVVVQKSALL